MSKAPNKISIAKSININHGPKAKTGINGAIKPTSKIAKSAQSGEATESDDANTNDDGEVSTDEEGGSSWEAGKPVSKDAEKYAHKTTKALWSGYWDFKRSELDHQRGMQQDQLDFQKQQQAAAMAQQNSGIGAGIAAQGIGALTSALGAMKGSGGGSGASSGGGSGTSVKPEEHNDPHKKTFEDEEKIVRVDSKGNPIVENPQIGPDGQVIHNPNQTQQVADTSFQSRPSAHSDMTPNDASAQDYDNVNGLSINSHEEMRADDDIIDFEFAQNEEVPEAEVPEIEIELEEELS